MNCDEFEKLKGFSCWYSCTVNFLSECSNYPKGVRVKSSGVVANSLRMIGPHLSLTAQWEGWLRGSQLCFVCVCIKTLFIYTRLWVSSLNFLSYWWLMQQNKFWAWKYVYCTPHYWRVLSKEEDKRRKLIGKTHWVSKRKQSLGWKKLENLFFGHVAQPYSLVYKEKNKGDKMAACDAPEFRVLMSDTSSFTHRRGFQSTTFGMNSQELIICKNIKEIKVRLWSVLTHGENLEG